MCTHGSRLTSAKAVLAYRTFLSSSMREQSHHESNQRAWFGPFLFCRGRPSGYGSARTGPKHPEPLHLHAEKACRKVKASKANEEGDWAQWSCPGRGGYVLSVFEADLRNVLARQAADEKARGFRCGADEIAIVGKPRRGTGLAKPDAKP